MKATNVRVKSSAGTVVSERRPILRAMFAPNSVALIGASEKPGSVGRALLENLQSFRGRVFPINPSHATVLGQKAFGIGFPCCFASCESVSSRHSSP